MRTFAEQSLLAKIKKMDLGVREEEVSQCSTVLAAPNLTRTDTVRLRSCSRRCRPSPPSWRQGSSSEHPSCQGCLHEFRGTDARNLKCSPLLLLTPSAASDFAPTAPPYDSVVVGLAPDSLNYHKLNEAFRLLSPEDSKAKKAELIVTHKAKYFRDKDGGLSLGPGPFISALEEASSVEAQVGQSHPGDKALAPQTHFSES